MWAFLSSLGAAAVVVVVIWLPFSIACFVASPVSLVGFLLFRNRYSMDILYAMDLLLAALLGLGYKYTVSAWCAVKRSLPFRALRAVLNKVEPRTGPHSLPHCEASAVDEGLMTLEQALAA